jgi:hypothetical protein
LFEHRTRTVFAGEDERVFCSPTKGTPFDVARYGETFRLALTTAGVADYVRPFHDMRHSSITNAAAVGTPPAALMARAGHSEFKTTQGYIDLAGETFREEADRLEERLWGDSSTKTGTKSTLTRPRRFRLLDRPRLNGAAQESNLPSRGLHDRTGFEDQLGHRAHAAP